MLGNNNKKIKNKFFLKKTIKVTACNENIICHLHKLLERGVCSKILPPGIGFFWKMFVFLMFLVSRRMTE